MVGEEGAEEEAEVEEDSGMRTGVIVREATRRVAALLGDAGARAMIVGVRAGARHRGGESAITVLREVVVDGGAARATRMLATGAIAVIAVVAVVGIVADVGGRVKQINVKEMKSRNGDSKHLFKNESVIISRDV